MACPVLADMARAIMEVYPWAPLFFIPFIIIATFTVLNLFIGIIMNSMAEMHAELAQQDREQHEREIGCVTLEDELRMLEQELKETQTRVSDLRRKWARAGTPGAGGRKPEEISV